MVLNNWSNSLSSGCKSFVLKEKLKVINGALKTWNRQAFGVLDSQVSLLRDAVYYVDERVEWKVVSLEELDDKRKASSDL